MLQMLRSVSTTDTPLGQLVQSHNFWTSHKRTQWLIETVHYQTRDDHGLSLGRSNFLQEKEFVSNPTPVVSLMHGHQLTNQLDHLNLIITAIDEYWESELLWDSELELLETTQSLKDKVTYLLDPDEHIMRRLWPSDPPNFVDRTIRLLCIGHHPASCTHLQQMICWLFWCLIGKRNGPLAPLLITWRSAHFQAVLGMP